MNDNVYWEMIVFDLLFVGWEIEGIVWKGDILLFWLLVLFWMMMVEKWDDCFVVVFNIGLCYCMVDENK